MQAISTPMQLTVRRADTFFSRLIGLLFSPPLQSGHALLIVPCASVHTAFMRFTIDVIFLDRAGRIKKIVPHLKPWRAATCAEAHQTLELAAGEAKRMGLTRGVSLASNLNAFKQEIPA